MKNISEDEIALKDRVAAELAIASESLSKITRSSSSPEDLIWRANAHTELAIGILKLVIDEGEARENKKGEDRNRFILSKVSTTAKFEKIQELLKNAIEDLREENLEKCLSDMRNAGDQLTSILAVELKRNWRK